MLGTTLGSYRIQREIGRGGMGAVYIAEHALLGRQAAVKVLLSELSRNQEIVQRFFNEARAATAIRHAGIVEVYDFGFATDGAAYIVMELLDGESLASRLRSGPIAVSVALGLTRQIAAALSAAHKKGIVHRDLKPDNIFLVPDPEIVGGERVKLLDFGIAKLASESQVARTSTGAVMGTPLYMSPEQCRGAGLVDARSDLYSLGCMLYQMVTGRVPFMAEGAGDLIAMHIMVPPEPASRWTNLPSDVDALITQLLAKKPEERLQSSDALVGALGALGARAAGTTAREVSGSVAVKPTTAPTPPVAAAAPAPVPPPHPEPIEAAPVRTTLSASTGQVAPAPPGELVGVARSRKPLAIAALVGIGAIAAVVVILVARPSSSKPPEPEAVAANQLDAAARAVPPASHDAAVIAPTDAAPAPPSAAVPDAGAPDATPPTPSIPTVTPSASPAVGTWSGSLVEKLSGTKRTKLVLSANGRARGAGKWVGKWSLRKQKLTVTLRYPDEPEEERWVGTLSDDGRFRGKMAMYAGGERDYSYDYTFSLKRAP